MESRTAAVHIVHFISDPSLLIDVWIVWMPLFCWAGYSIMSSIEPRDEAECFAWRGMEPGCDTEGAKWSEINWPGMMQVLGIIRRARRGNF